jgi:hypothetical protein
MLGRRVPLHVTLRSLGSGPVSGIVRRMRPPWLPTNPFLRLPDWFETFGDDLCCLIAVSAPVGQMVTGRGTSHRCDLVAAVGEVI